MTMSLLGHRVGCHIRKYYLLSAIYKIYSPCASTVLTRKAARTAAAATLGSGDAASILGILGRCGWCWSCTQRGYYPGYNGASICG